MTAMVEVTFVQPDGQSRTVNAKPGDTLMDVALDNAVAGIIAQCGGGCTCCTCHCWIEEPWLSRLPPPHQDEIDMLAYAWGFGPGSRLACQVAVDGSIAGVVVRVPAQQS